MKNDFLSDALRRGDPAEAQPETGSAEARKDVLLARCAAERFTQPASLPSAAQKHPVRKTRWAFPALAGAGALTAAALCGAMAWFGASRHASQTMPAQMAQGRPRPSAAPARRAVPAGNVTARAGERKPPLKRRDMSVANPIATVRAIKPVIPAKLFRQDGAFSPTPIKTIVRANQRKVTAESRLIVNATKAQATVALSKNVEPIVERVIIEQDATPAESAPTVTTVAITMNGRAESVIVSRAAEPAAN